MTSLMDSEAVLKARLTEACLPEENVNVLLNKQITTLRKLAYSVCTPTTTASDAQLNALVKTSDAEAVGVAILAAIRQVHLEAQTLEVALKNLVEPQNDSAATELPLAEHNKQGNAKGKGTPNVLGKGVNAPKKLRDKQLTPSNGERICWNFNLDSRQDAEPGGRCPRGHHVCAEPHCQQAHQGKHHPR